jgi:two-component system cell cycle sensor histidine kinase/response regulator CckA
MNAPTDPTDRRPLVLVADDEKDVREMIREILRFAGMDTILAPNGQEALRLLEERRGAVDLILTDVMMPVLDGPALAHQAALEWPDIPVLFMTGHTVELLASRGLLGENTPRIEKPFQVRQLIRTLQDALGRPP